MGPVPKYSIYNPILRWHNVATWPMLHPMLLRTRVEVSSELGDIYPLTPINTPAFPVGLLGSLPVYIADVNPGSPV